MLSYLTYSIVKDFLTCPEKCRLAHVLRLQSKIVSSTVLLGKSVHKSVETYYKQGVLPSKVFKSYVENDDALRKSCNYEKVISLLEQFVRHPETPPLSEAFKVEETFKVDVKGVPFFATIDFVGKNGRGIYVLDWKTSASAYHPRRANYDLQLTAYSYVLAHHFEVPEKVGFGVFVKDEVCVNYVWGRKRTKEDFINFEKLVAKVEADLQKGTFFKVVGVHCLWCEFDPLCQGVASIEDYEVRKYGYLL